MSSFSDKLAQREIEQGAVHLGLWAQALQKARGDQAVAKTLYMRLRSDALSKQAPALLLKQIRTGLAKDRQQAADYVSAKDLKKP